MRTVFYKLKAMTGGFGILAAMLAAAAACFLTVNLALSRASSKEIAVSVVDLDCSELSERFIALLEDAPGLRVEVRSVGDAETSLAKGQAESLLYIDEGFENAMLTGAGLPLRFVTGSLGVAGEATREIIGGRALSMQSAMDAVSRLKEDYGEDNPEPEALFYDRLSDAESSSRPLLVYVRQAERSPTEQPVFGRTYARYSGFSSLIILLFVMSLSVMLSSEASRTVNRTMKGIKKGKHCGVVTDWLALLAAALLLSVLALACKGSGDFGEWAAYGAYSVCVAGICTSLSFTRAGGGIDVTAPLIAMITGVIGGCFFDTAALGGIMRTLSLLTPQGLLIQAVGGSGFCCVILSAVGLLLLAVSAAAAECR